MSTGLFRIPRGIAKHRYASGKIGGYFNSDPVDINVHPTDFLMKNKFLLSLSLILMTCSASATPFQSTTSAYVTFRQCIAGETACDSISPTQVSEVAGLPGDREAQTSQTDPAYGSSSGHAKLMTTPGAAELTGKISSLPGTRNGSTVFMLERYTNTSESTQSLTFSGQLTFEKMVPAGNAEGQAERGNRSLAFAELAVFTLNVEFLDLGSSAMDNMNFIHADLPADMQETSMGSAQESVDKNKSVAGSKVLSVNVDLDPGKSIWLLALLQNIGANAAEVNSEMVTRMTIGE